MILYKHGFLAPQLYVFKMAGEQFRIGYISGCPSNTTNRGLHFKCVFYKVLREHLPSVVLGVGRKPGSL